MRTTNVWKRLAGIGLIAMMFAVSGWGAVFSINDVTSTEGTGGSKTYTFTVTASATVASPCTKSTTYSVDWATENATAVAGSDYTAASGTKSLTTGSGNNSNKTSGICETGTISITGNTDSLYENNEDFYINLSNPSANAVIGDNQGIGTITNDDTAPTLSIANVSVAEGNSGTKTLTFTITQSAASGIDTTVLVSTSDGTATVADNDYVALASESVTIPAGSTTATVSVTINGDTTDSSTETFTVTLSNPNNATIATATAIGTITNDETTGGGGIIAPIFPDLDACGLFPSPLSTRNTLNVSGNGSANSVVFNVKNINAKTVEGDKIKCTTDIENGQGTCNGNSPGTEAECTCTILPPPSPITLPTFMLSEGGTKTLTSPVTLDDAGDITMGASLTLQASSPYGDSDKKYMKIGEINVVTNNATLTLTEGDYWIERLTVDANGFNLVTQGAVRLFIQEDINFNAGSNSAEINAAGEPKDLLIFAYKNLNFNANGGGKSTMNAFWYMNGSMTNNMDAAAGEFNGGFTAQENITLDKNQDFIYPTNGGLPDGFGECAVTYTFQTGAFDAVDICGAKNNTCIGTNIKTKIVSSPFSLTALSLNSARNALQTRNPAVSIDASLAKNNGSAYDIVKPLGSVTFTSSASALDVNLISHDAAAKDLRVLFRFCKDASGGISSWNAVSCGAGKTQDYSLSSDNFALRPAAFSIDEVTTPDLLKSGETYTMTVHANPYGSTTGNTVDYNQAKANLTMAVDKQMPDGTVNNDLSGLETFSDFAITDGLSSGASFTFSDVGKITVKIDDTDWAAVDNGDGSSAAEQTIHGEADFTFIPFRFFVSNARIVDSRDGIFTYLSNDLTMAAKLDFMVTAENKDGDPTANFATGLYENPVSITPSVSDTLQGGANETVITNALIGFTAGTKQIAWNDADAAKVLKFNFTRPNTPINPIEVVASEVNLLVSSTYTNGGVAVIENEAANQSGATNGITGNAVFLYGRADAPDYRFSTPTGCGRIYFEFYNTIANNPIVTGAFGSMPPMSFTPDRNWYQNTLHNFATDGNVTALIATSVNAAGTTGCIGSAGLGTQKRAFVYDEGQDYPYRTTVALDASDWLDVANNNFGLEYRKEGAWIGVNSENKVKATHVDAELNSNRRIMW